MGRRCACALMALVLLMGQAGWARTWTDTTGRFRIEAELVEVRDGKAVLKKADGSQLEVPVEKLSPADREFLKKPIGQADKPADTAAPADKAEVRKGKYTISFTEHSPLAATGVIIPRMHTPSGTQQRLAELVKAGGRVADFYYRLEEEEWTVVVPLDYDPSTGPYGLFLFISAGDEASAPADWLEALAKHRLIYVTAKNSGNEKDVALRRVPLMLEAVYNLSKVYSIDSDRVYISGHSGGGRSANWAALAYPDVFAGGQFHCGPQAVQAMPTSKLTPMAQQRNRYVFLTGDKDMNRKETMDVANAWTRQGYRYITYLQVPELGHARPNGEWFEKGLIALDKPLRDAAQTTYDQALKAERRGQLGEALLGFTAAAAHGHGQDFATEALTKANVLREKYQEDVNAAEKAIEAGERNAALLLGALRTRWGKAGQADAARLLDANRKKARRGGSDEKAEKKAESAARE